MANEEVKVTAVGEVSNLVAAMDKAGSAAGHMASSVESAAGKAERSSEGMRGKIVEAVGAIGVAMGIGFGVEKIVEFGKKTAEAALEAQKGIAQTNAVLKSTKGVSNESAAGIDTLTAAVSKKTAADAEQVRSGENMLLTFTNIRNETGKGNDVFNQSTAVLADMSRAMGVDMKTQAIQLGKALGDPTKGMSALARVGVTFDAQQTKSIKTMQAAGNMMGAQKIILAELNKEFGGSGAAYAHTWAGSIDGAKNSLKELQVTIGGKVLPAFAAMARGAGDGFSWLNDKIPEISKAMHGPMTEIESTVKSVFGQVVSAVGPVVKALMGQLAPILPVLAREFMAVGPALSPIGLIFRAMLPILPQVANLIGTLVVTLANGLLPVVPMVTKVVNILVSLLGGVFAAALPVVTAAVNALMMVFKAVMPPVLALVPIIVQLIAVILDAVKPVFSLITALSPLLAALGVLLSALLPPIIQILGVLIQVLIAVAEPLLKLLIPALTFLIQVIVTVITWVVQVVSAFVQWAAKSGVVTALISGYFKMMKGEIQIAIDIVTAIIKGVAAVINWLWTNAVKPVIDWIVGAFRNVARVVSAEASFIGGVLRGVGGYFSNLWSLLSGIFGRIASAWGALWKGAASVVGGAFSSVVGVVRGAINGVIGMINGAISAIDSIHVSIPKGIPLVGGLNFGVNIPTIPMLAKGGNVISGGHAIVGEAGPELITLPVGAKVTPLSKGGQPGGGNTYHFEINVPAKADRDDVEYADRLLSAIRFAVGADAAASA